MNILSRSASWIFVLGALFLVNPGCKKDNTGILPSSDYVVFAWNDLGMHCLNPSYNELVILPPYNNLVAQVIKRGAKPEIVTSGITVGYSLVNNTYSKGKRNYGQFWDYSGKLFGTVLVKDIGLKGKGLTGQMDIAGEVYQAVGIPVVPVDDTGTWNPFQEAVVTVKDGSGTVIATIHTTVPTSDEISCSKCHISGASAFADILAKHDKTSGTKLLSDQPVLCASCHGSPALGMMTPGSSGKYLSQAIHGYHAGKQASCYDCHPGATTKCNRSLAHTADNGNCTVCHGELAQVAQSIADGRVPWVSEPKCITCHPGVPEVDTGTGLYRNSAGHGGLNCITCHGSPHAMMPSRIATDNYSSVQYQNFNNRIKSIGSCGTCHDKSKGEGSSEFGGVHGGANPQKKNGCHICHTEVPVTTAKWPHQFLWKAR